MTGRPARFSRAAAAPICRISETPIAPMPRAGRKSIVGEGKAVMGPRMDRVIATAVAHSSGGNHTIDAIAGIRKLDLAATACRRLPWRHQRPCSLRRNRSWSSAKSTLNRRDFSVPACASNSSTWRAPGASVRQCRRFYVVGDLAGEKHDVTEDHSPASPRALVNASDVLHCRNSLRPSGLRISETGGSDTAAMIERCLD